MKQLSELDKITLPTGAGKSMVKLKARSRRRILGRPEISSNCYHLMSRTAGGERVFGSTEKEGFRRLMWRLAKFSGVRILTYAVMDNHFHLLVSVPNREKFLARFEGPDGEEKLLEHLKLLYSKDYLTQLRREVADFRERGMPEAAETLLAKFRERFCNVSLFVKELKERFSRWFNKKEGRRGTLWMDRFKSVLVENGEALQTMAAYIDLNAVRAGIVKDPKDYRWCGYGEAMGGSKRARRGLCRVLDCALDSWEMPCAGKEGGITPAGIYRCWLFGDGKVVEDAESPSLGKKKRLGFTKEEVDAVKAAGGKLSRSQLLRCRVRYFSDGAAIGSREFVNSVFAQHRDSFGPKRKEGAKVIAEAQKDEALFSLRALRVRAVE
jgi:REP element-mobilizing transposase RayT